MAAVINKLPWEFHLPVLQSFQPSEKIEGGLLNEKSSYSFCGPGTKFNERIAQGYAGINHLDRLCREHDQAYTNFHTDQDRLEADRRLASKALELAMHPGHDPMERVYALIVSLYFNGSASHFRVGNRSIGEFLGRFPNYSPGRVSSKKLLSSVLYKGPRSIDMISAVRRLGFSDFKFDNIFGHSSRRLPSSYVYNLRRKRRRYRRRRYRVVRN